MTKLALGNATGAVIEAQPLVGADRDEIVRLVRRLKEADAKRFQVQGQTLSAEAVAWAESWQLPMDVFQYFTLDEAKQHSR